ncbi:MAG: hypothetical protein KDC60_04200 [Bacteroidetes bacterium]|nr:hypothetical protein [Bacteroidota bacterium]MCB0513613.1 hypothetical protein [Bacteroidota bacterium]MCB9074195.1 hypothetical protein [Chitinophagales bacterium]
MGLIQNIRHKIVDFIVKKAIENRTIDILEVRTKAINLTYVDLETDIKISNSFFLPIKVLEIKTDIINTAELKIGALHYDKVQKIKGHQSAIFTTHTQISNITALFNLISKLLTLSIKMRSVGIAKIKVFWFVVDIPVDDVFEIKSHQLRIIGELTAEEKAAREEQKKVKKDAYEQKITERKQKRLEIKEQKKQKSEDMKDAENTMDITINEDALKSMEKELDDELNRQENKE